MGNFTFKALDLAGIPTTARSRPATSRRSPPSCARKGLIVLDIEEQKPANAGDLLANFKRVKSADLTIATRQLSVMISSGMSLLRALYVIEEQTENELLKETWVEVRKDVEAGVSLSDALGRHPDVFNDLYVAMVAAGETGGILEQTLVRVSDQLEADDALRRQVRAAMVYPSVIGSFALIVLFALVTFLVPVFEGVFKDFGGELPAITKFTVALSHLFIHQWYMLFGGTGAGRVRLQALERHRARQGPVGHLQAEDPDEDRGHRAEGGAGSLLPHLLGPDRRRRAHARGDRDHRAHLGQQGDRERHGEVGESVKNGGTITAPMRTVPAAFPAWSPRWWAWARRPARSRRCCRRSPTSTRTR